MASTASPSLFTLLRYITEDLVRRAFVIYQLHQKRWHRSQGQRSPKVLKGTADRWMNKGKGGKSFLKLVNVNVSEFEVGTMTISIDLLCVHQCLRLFRQQSDTGTIDVTFYLSSATF